MKYDVVIIGAGIVGLSTAYSLSQKNPNLKISIFEKESDIAQHQTGNNSGVIHSGIYYKPGSLKALNCKKGYNMLLSFCEEHDIPYDLCGKIIVATTEEEKTQIARIYKNGIANGLEDLSILNEKEIKEIEPHCEGIQAVHVPQAGIIDYKEVCRVLLELLKNSNLAVVLNSEIIKIEATEEEVQFLTNDMWLSSDILINCCGLYSDRIYEESTSKKATYKIVPFRGEYYELKPSVESLVKGLIYPVPNPEFPFLGVHFTKMIHGGVEAGPNAVLAFAREGYKKSDINLKDLAETLTYSGFLSIVRKYWKDGMYEMYRSYSKKAFVKAMKKLIPSITVDDVVRGGAGVRAQAVYSNGDMIDDFVIEYDGAVVNVCNAPSPAATSSFAIGETIANAVINYKSKLIK